MFKLVIQDDEGKTTIVPLIRDEITIGRKEGNTIRLTERNVSRRHARILRNNGEVHIEDLGSYNGIRVNNARIAERVSLRVSDQVQIGDYKLYLKAEGVEQVDDARTMPIERVDSQVPTESMNAVTPLAGPAPTTQMGAVTAASPPVAPQLIGNPNRTLVAIADTDHSGRPVATAATIATLQAPLGYGKLVVMSSNFAGKEFELSRPQMIIGRTDENDIVINHRSISRNHAKLVREPETGRYTISDLQSSNGVRVNGQDYGKVELRRGDMIDLGHVRLRFIEPGEDFVFARDAVITDVPEGGSRRGMMMVIATVVVIAAAVVFYVIHSSSSSSSNNTDTNVVSPTGSNAIDAGAEQVAVKTPGSDEVQQPPPVTPDAAPAGTVAKDDKTALLMQCTDAKTRNDWQGLEDCANRLDGPEAKDLRATAKSEQAAQITQEKLRTAIRERNFDDARKLIGTIKDDSVYRAGAKKDYDDFIRHETESARHQAQNYANTHQCPTLATYISQQPEEIANALKSIKCKKEPAVATNPPNPVNPQNPPGPGSGSAVVEKTVPPPQPACTPAQGDDWVTQAKNQYQAGYAKAALALMTKAFACKSDAHMYQLAAMYACRAHDAGAAKQYYGKLTSGQSSIQQACQQEGITLP